MKNISEQVRAFIRNQDLRFEQTKGGCFKGSFKGLTATFSVFIHVDDNKHLLSAYTICPLTIPKAKLTAVTKLIARINCMLIMGNFDIDMEDGTLLARMAIKLGDIELDCDTLKGIIFGGWVTMDYCFPAIASVVLKDISPSEALAELEDNWHKSIRQNKSRMDKLPSDERFNRWMGFFSNN